MTTPTTPLTEIARLIRAGRPCPAWILSHEARELADRLVRSGRLVQYIGPDGGFSFRVPTPASH